MKRKPVVLAIVVSVSAVVLAWKLGRVGDGAGTSIDASGTVEATEARLGFQATGRLETVTVREGDAVRAGQELARLDRTEMLARRQQAAAQAAMARAQLRELEIGSRHEEIAQARAAADAAAERMSDARRDFARTKRLFEGGAASREAYDKAASALELAGAHHRQTVEQLRLVEAGPRHERIEAQRAQLAQAEAAVATADAILANMVVRAPFDGVVTVRHREPGEVLQPGSPVLTIMNPADRWVRIYVPENRLGAIRIGMRATISSDTYRGKGYAGELSFIAPEAEFTPKAVQTTEERVKLVYAVKVRVADDAANDLKPGMPADVRLAVGESRP